jgi:hypothetical protein
MSRALPRRSFLYQSKILRLCSRSKSSSRDSSVSNADIIITGDKGFLESGIDKPRIMTAAEFLMGRQAN